MPVYYVANPPEALKKYGRSSQQIFDSVFGFIDVDIIVGNKKSKRNIGLMCVWLINGNGPNQNLFHKLEIMRLK